MYFGEFSKSLYFVVFSFETWKPHLWLSESHDEEEKEDGDDDDEDDEGDEAEEAEEENDRPYNLRQRKTVQRYEAPPIGVIFLSVPLYIFVNTVWLVIWQCVLCLLSQSLWTENRATHHFLTPIGPQQEEAI